MSRIESTDMSNEQAIATHTALMLGQKQAIYRGSKDGLRVYYLAGEKYPDSDRKEEAVFFVVDEETGKYTVMTHADLRQERLERQNGITHAEQDEAFISSLMSEDSDYLEHYGIKGMKWGIRRFQNKDGSLTKAGLKRYSDAASDVASKVGKAVAEGGKKLGEAAGKAAQAAKTKISEKHAERKEEKRVEKLMSKPIRKLTEEERIERMDRKMKEKALLDLEKNVRNLDEAAMTKGRKFVEDMVTKVAIPSVLSAGEKQLTAFLNKKLGDALGLGEKDSTVVSDLLTGKRPIDSLTDKEFNSLGKIGEGMSNFVKTPLGKIFGPNNQNDDGGPSTTNLKDILSGKKNVTDFDDKTIKENEKTVDAARKTEEFVKKYRTAEQSSESDSKPKGESKSNSESKPNSNSNSNSESSPQSKAQIKPKPNDTNSSKRTKSIENMSDAEAKAYRDRLDLNMKISDMEDAKAKRETERGYTWTMDQIDWEYY